MTPADRLANRGLARANPAQRRRANLRRSDHRRRPGRLDGGDSARRAGLPRGGGGKGPPSALPHRRVAAARQFAAARAARRGGSRFAPSAWRNGARNSSRRGMGGARNSNSRKQLGQVLGLRLSGQTLRIRRDSHPACRSREAPRSSKAAARARWSFSTTAAARGCRPCTMTGAPNPGTPSISSTPPAAIRFSGTRLQAKRRNKKHNSAAMYAHFTGARRESRQTRGQYRDILVRSRLVLVHSARRWRDQRRRRGLAALHEDAAMSVCASFSCPPSPCVRRWRQRLSEAEICSAGRGDRQLLLRLRSLRMERIICWWAMPTPSSTRYSPRE